MRFIITCRAVVGQQGSSPHQGKNNEPVLNVPTSANENVLPAWNFPGSRDINDDPHRQLQGGVQIGSLGEAPADSSHPLHINIT
jgi:hypothetical protein